jgi:hypothetical protein
VKLLITILLVSIIINTGYFFIYQILIFRAKRNATILIRNSNHPERIQTLKLTNKEAKFYEEDEITYQGKLFDVAKRMALRDSVVLFLYADNDEQNILTELANYFKSDDSSIIPAGEKILRIKTLRANPDQIAQYITRLTLPINCTVSFLSLLQKADQMSDRHEPVPTPPPEFFPV